VLITVTSGVVLSLSVRKGRREMRVRDSILLVALIWSLLPAFGALPLYLHIAGLSWTDAYFEAVSGLTATGATVLSGLDQLPLSINFWRTFMHWVGGLGVVVLAVAILPLLGFGGRSMLKAETPGPMKDAKITPRITETAKGLWVVYVILTAACALSLHFVGMEPWDALMHAFSMMGLGGFSTKDASLGHFDSLDIEMVVIFLPCSPASTSARTSSFFSKRSLRAYLADVEAHYFLGILALSCLALAIYLWPDGIYDDFLTTLRYVTFHSVSLATSLGFATTDYTCSGPCSASCGSFFLAASSPARVRPAAASR
jgi:trk system potassium uptake protein TrkH